jgi:MYXO-CTERM domain-containing protein
MFNCGTCSGTDVCVANQCMAAGTDAGMVGVDSGSNGDAGMMIDAGSPIDASVSDSGGSIDSGASDSGSAMDASQPPTDSGADSGRASDGGPIAHHDAAPPPNDAAEGDGGNTPQGAGDDNGCGCRTASTRTSPTWPLVAAGAFAIAALGVRRRRRSRR